MSVLHAAVPIFFGLIGLEWLAARRRGRNVYALADTVTDLGCGILSQICGIFLALLNLAVYRFAAEHASLVEALSIPEWPVGGPLASPRAAIAWLIIVLLVDFGQYWVHRASHRVSVLWACHLVHHSSEELNFAVALRNSSLHGAFLWIVPLPLALAGVPWEVFAVCYGLNVAYQFWLHTRVIGRLGWLESILNTPSHHRVHHGRDLEYLDRNFGGILIIWDRLFGTFARETREPEYGIRARIGGSNPVWANLWGFSAIAREIRRRHGIAGKLAAVLGPPRWGDAALDQVPPADEARAKLLPLTYALVQFTVLFGATIALLEELGRAALLDVTAWGLLAALTLTGVSAIMDARPWAFRMELLRLGAVGVAAFAPGLQSTRLLESAFLGSPLLLTYVAASVTMLVLVSGSFPRGLAALESRDQG